MSVLNKQAHAPVLHGGAVTESVQVHYLPNGVPVVIEHLPYLHGATAGVWFRTGSLNEAEEENGLAHFIEHLFFKGTTNRSFHQIAVDIEGRGGQINAFTSHEYTCIYVRMMSEHIPFGLEVLADIVKNPLFAEEEIEKERNVVLEEIAAIEDSPDDYVFELLHEFHWEDHPLGRPISGTEDSVSRFTRQEIVDFYRRWYQPGNMLISVVGNVDTAAVLEKVTEEFAALPSNTHALDIPPPQFRSGTKAFPRDINQAHIALAFPAPTVTDPKRYVCDLASTILGGGTTSWLFHRIREELGLAYSVFTFHSFHKLSGVVGVYAAVAPEAVERTFEEIYQQLRKLRDEGVSQSELEMNREQLKGNLLLALESSSHRMSRYARSLIFHNRIVSVTEILERIHTVSREEVQQFAQETFTPDKCAAVVHGRTNGAQWDRVLL
jgi:predicted Zn-dependent peptidase